MVWRGWTFFCGIPVGALCAQAIDPQIGAVALGVGSVAGGLVLVLVAHLATRLGDADLGRGWHLAKAATWALASVPALAAARLGLGPTAPWLLLLCTVAAAVGILLGARRRDPAPGAAGWMASAALVLAVSSVAVVALGALTAAFSPALAAVSEQRAMAIYDADARIITQPLPGCRPQVAKARILLDHGAHPRLGGDGRYVWFDAETEDGTRQVHRLELGSGEVTCWTCGEPGNNQRPAPQRPGSSLVFDSDRHVSLNEPTNTELYLARAVGSPRPARRISFHPGADDHAVFMESGVVVWSRGWGSSYDVVSATVRSGHGSRFLGTPGRMFRGGARWAIPPELVARPAPPRGRGRPAAAAAPGDAPGPGHRHLAGAPGSGGTGISGLLRRRRRLDADRLDGACGHRVAPSCNSRLPAPQGPTWSRGRWTIPHHPGPHG